MTCTNEVIDDILTKISTKNLIKELVSRDEVKELIFSCDDQVTVTGHDCESKLTYEAEGPLQILVLRDDV